MYRCALRAAIFSLACVLTACNGSGLDMMSAMGIQDVHGQSLPVPVLIDAEAPNSPCRGENSSFICLASKWVVFNDAAGNPVMSREEAIQTIARINSVWGKCDLAFTLEEFVAVNPAEHNIKFQIANYTDLTAIRRTFSDDSSLLVAFTGTWDREGSLGKTGANAWTTLPGSGPYGAILEKPVARNANLIGHELGHYLNLSHVEDSDLLMNAVIYRKSTSIPSDQCRKARSAARNYWARMVR